MTPALTLRPIGLVMSDLRDPVLAPKQGWEGAPDAWLVLDPHMHEGLRDLTPRTTLIVLTWLHRARRDVLSARPRDNPDSHELGVFSTRSPDRPNPIGLHHVELLQIAGTRLLVRNLEAVHRTPVLDIKPWISRGDTTGGVNVSGTPVSLDTPDGYRYP